MTDLYSVDKKIVMPRNKIAASILTVIECLSEFYNYDLKKLSDEWNLIDYNWYDKTIVVDKKRMNVEIKGINNIGQVLFS